MKLRVPTDEWVKRADVARLLERRRWSTWMLWYKRTTHLARKADATTAGVESVVLYRGNVESRAIWTRANRRWNAYANAVQRRIDATWESMMENPK
jgi:hypothetical protein